MACNAYMTPSFLQELEHDACPGQPRRAYFLELLFNGIVVLSFPSDRVKLKLCAFGLHLHTCRL